MADVTGLRITMAATQSSEFGGAALWGPMLFLAGLDVLLRADAAWRHQAPVVENDPSGPTPFERATRLTEAIEHSELIGAFGNALGAALSAFQAVLFAWDIVMPALWGVSDGSGDQAYSNQPSGYLAEMRQMAVMMALWQEVRPRLATQRGLTT
jgi:hypothetical protein